MYYFKFVWEGKLPYKMSAITELISAMDVFHNIRSYGGHVTCVSFLARKLGVRREERHLSN